MQKKIITTGDTNSSGGKVISGSAAHTIMGRAIARMGDMVDCPARYPGGKPHGVNPIVEGAENFPIDGIPVAVEGFKSACGCTLVGSSLATTQVSGVARLAQPDAPAPEVGFAAELGQPVFNEQFRLVGEDGSPMAQVPFHITDEQGNVFTGLSDADGRCARVYTDGAQTLTLLTGVAALEKW
jgi:uncharacterized Zn-binding protein involved in type VI secretion